MVRTAIFFHHPYSPFTSSSQPIQVSEFVAVELAAIFAADGLPR
jgi:hypothetical protein